MNGEVSHRFQLEFGVSCAFLFLVQSDWAVTWEWLSARRDEMELSEVRSEWQGDHVVWTMSLSLGDKNTESRGFYERHFFSRRNWLRKHIHHSKFKELMQPFGTALCKLTTITLLISPPFETVYTIQYVFIFTKCKNNSEKNWRQIENWRTLWHRKYNRHTWMWFFRLYHVSKYCLPKSLSHFLLSIHTVHI